MHFTIVARSCILACLLNLPYAFAFPNPTIQPRQYLPVSATSLDLSLSEPCPFINSFLRNQELVRGDVRDAGAAGSTPFTNPFGGSPPPNLPPPGSPPPQFADAVSSIGSFCILSKVAYSPECQLTDFKI